MIRYATKFVITFALTLLLGCSNSNPEITTPQIPQFKLYPQQADSRWHWGASVFQVNADHTQIERIPIREATLHYNVTKFVESTPCPNCLTFGPIQPQNDGTFKIDVRLRHPFSGQLRYTGFDVRGTVVFQATHYWEVSYGLSPHDPPYELYWLLTPYFFSRASSGGGELLNAEGYSFYFFPGFPAGPDIPVFRYQKGKFATETDDLDSTINPFVEFHSHKERRMFLPDEEVVRTYHIKPPEGAFKFGYIVDASWTEPDVLPVTDPAKDFPYYANAEDPVSVEFEQTAPLRNGETGNEVTRWTVRHRKDFPVAEVYIWMDINTKYGTSEFPVPIIGKYFSSNPKGERFPLDDYTDLTTQILRNELEDNPPGKYLAIAGALGYYDDTPGSALFLVSTGYQIVELELVE